MNSAKTVTFEVLPKRKFRICAKMKKNIFSFSTLPTLISYVQILCNNKCSAGSNTTKSSCWQLYLYCAGSQKCN